jgi:thiol:disulfide interchange protein
VLFTKDIEAAFKDNGVQMLRGDNTRKDDTINEWLTKFKRAGVPLYLFYIPNQTEPEVLPEIITKDMIYKLIDKL